METDVVAFLPPDRILGQTHHVYVLSDVRLVGVYCSVGLRGCTVKRNSTLDGNPGLSGRTVVMMDAGCWLLQFHMHGHIWLRDGTFP